MFIIVHPYEWNMFLTFIILGLFKVIVCSHQGNHHSRTIWEKISYSFQASNMRIQVIHWFSSVFFSQDPAEEIFLTHRTLIEKSLYNATMCFLLGVFFQVGRWQKSGQP